MKEHKMSSDAGSQGLTNKAEANEEDQCKERLLTAKVFDGYFSVYLCSRLSLSHAQGENLAQVLFLDCDDLSRLGRDSRERQRGEQRAKTAERTEVTVSLAILSRSTVFVFVLLVFWASHFLWAFFGTVSGFF